MGRQAGNEPPVRGGGIVLRETALPRDLHECLAFDNTFKSRIPGWLGLPEHPAANTAEGKVIKPFRVATLANGARIILKDKAEAFTEVHECARRARIRA